MQILLASTAEFTKINVTHSQLPRYLNLERNIKLLKHKAENIRVIKVIDIKYGMAVLLNRYAMGIVSCSGITVVRRY